MEWPVRSYYGMKVRGGGGGGAAGEGCRGECGRATSCSVCLRDALIVKTRAVGGVGIVVSTNRFPNRSRHPRPGSLRFQCVPGTPAPPTATFALWLLSLGLSRDRVQVVEQLLTDGNSSGSNGGGRRTRNATEVADGWRVTARPGGHGLLSSVNKSRLRS